MQIIKSKLKSREKLTRWESKIYYLSILDYRDKKDVINAYRKLITMENIELSEELQQRVMNTERLIESLKLELSKVIPLEFLRRKEKGKKSFGRSLKLSDMGLSRLIGHVDRYIQRKKASIRKDQKFLIAFNELTQWIDYLKARLGKESYGGIRLIHSYMLIHREDLKFSYGKGKIYNTHPFFNVDYFSIIDTLEKAYWLGFIFGDGSLYTRKDKRHSIYFRLVLGSSLSYRPSTYLHQFRFCNDVGLDPRIIYFSNYPVRTNGIIKYSKTVRLVFQSDKFGKDLIATGFKGSSQFATDWPLIDWAVDDAIKPLFDLAFVLGFYDAEGKKGRTDIVSASEKILRKIKHKLNLPFKIIPNLELNRKNPIWRLTLSAQLLNLMQAIYRPSLEMKRKRFRVYRYKETLFDRLLTEKLLRAIIKVMPKEKIADIFNVDVFRVQDLLTRWNIEEKFDEFWKRQIEDQFSKFGNDFYDSEKKIWT